MRRIIAKLLCFLFVGVFFPEWCPTEEVTLDCSARICTNEYAPICGSNGQTYINPCVFAYATYCDDPLLSMEHAGRCRQEEPRIDCSRRGCSRQYEPVCGSNGQTYSNPCLFKYAQHCDDQTLTRLSMGPCGREEVTLDCSARICTNEYAPICGSNGQTYINPCVFAYATYCDDPLLSMEHAGRCRQEEPRIDCSRRGCSRQYEPVCGSNGQTYSNPCLFKYAQHCDDQTLTRLSMGPCGIDTKTHPPQSLIAIDTNITSTTTITTTHHHPNAIIVIVVVVAIAIRIVAINTTIATATATATVTITTIHHVNCNALPEPPPHTPPHTAPPCHAIPSSSSSTSSTILVVIYAPGCFLASCLAADICDPKPVCTDDFAPLCGSNGVTYNNLCSFDVAVLCDDQHLTKTHEGRCERVRFTRERLRMVLPRGRKPVVRMDVTATIAADSSDSEGENLWQLEVFGSRSSDGNTTDRYEYRTQVLDADQASRPAIAGRSFAIRNVRIQFPLWEAACNGYQHLCARFSPTTGDNTPDNFSILTCHEVECQ
ncbi:hypothetical protein BSL78_08751 [Apostichopus japonicus]|uniref:Kazal-like domain-containing protein n=1 Tax=Stichopus japonicus TaxID=307972 RepID=A0A2G8L2D3_STIJA|nr:hypothetical protein BSL78_08751 [Apostichopus japonicus]